ncbi:MAG: hypothetical protein M3552_10480 [Planctomycetota bacterium]|nr:hypothetical protein [Planctomycetaceae bacterium]MDQ3331064.1 hypothetical protein [Planctomycetota bacterium]
MSSGRRKPLLALIVWLFGASSAFAAAGDPTLVVRDVIWGFDGTVMRDRFSPLTFVVDNPTAEPFDGVIRLYRADFSGRRVGGFYDELIYLAPATQRYVQFYPLILGDMETWMLEWEGGQAKLPTPRYGPPARVLLTQDGALAERGGAVKRFPARSFPPFTTATDTLSSVVLDHAPDWEAPRREAFLDWLKQGGGLHLMQGADGRPPRFTGDLAVLNEPSDEFRIGSGTVKRHAVGRSGLTSDYVRRQLDPPPRPVEETPEEIARANQDLTYSYPLEQWRMTTGVFNQLKRMVKVEHNWGVIHLLSLSYVAVLFPGCFLIGREFRNVPATFGAIVGATLLFGAAFYLVGNRGYGESDGVFSVALAEHIDDDRYDATAWSSVFVTSGGQYTFLHRGDERIYSDATDNEPVGGVTTAGSTGRFIADVPPYSTRIMSHKAVVQSLGAAAPVVIADPAAQTVFRLPKGFPASNEMYAIIDRKVFNYRRDGEFLRPLGNGTPVREFLRITDSDFLTDVPFGEHDTILDKRLSQLVRPLMLYSLRLTTDDELKAFYLPEGQAKIFIYAPLSGSFQSLFLPGAVGAEATNVEPIPMPAQAGGVLYSFNVAI